MSTLVLTSHTLAFEDLSANSNPTQRPIDWKRSVLGLVVDNPSTQRHELDPLAIATIVDGTRSTSIDGTSEFSLTLSPLDTTRYRIAHTAGTAPVFRTPRTVPVDGVQLTITLNQNQSINVVAGSGTPFTDVVSGDVVFLPGVSTGDAASPFNNLNLGTWTVLTATGTVLVLSRAAGTVFEGYGEVVTPTDDAQFQVFSSSGVQIGDTVNISAGFATSARRAYEIVGVTASRIEIVSTLPLGNETDVIPGAAGLVIYTAAKRFIQIESDQELVVRINGDLGDFNKISPWVPGDKNFPAEFRFVGPVWQLVLVNKASVVTNVVVLSAE